MRSRLLALGVIGIRLVVLAMFAAGILAGYAVSYAFFELGIWPVGVLISILLLPISFMFAVQAIGTVLSGIILLVVGMEVD